MSLLILFGRVVCGGENGGVGGVRVICVVEHSSSGDLGDGRW
jgi:hypothetical protein